MPSKVVVSRDVERISHESPISPPFRDYDVALLQVAEDRRLTAEIHLNDERTRHGKPVTAKTVRTRIRAARKRLNIRKRVVTRLDSDRNVVQFWSKS